MGASAIVIGAVALATGLIFLFFGYMWGRSNVKSKVEGAMDRARISADAREFALREQLDEMMLEVAKFRARAEESPRLPEPPAQLKLEQVHGSAGGGSSAEERGNTMQAAEKLPWQKQKAAPAIESTDKTIQNLLKSMEEKLKQPEEEPRVVTQQSPPPPPPRPAPTKLPVEEPRVVAQKVTPPPTPTPKLPAEEPRVVTQKSAPPPVPTTKLPTEKPIAVPRPSPRPATKSPTTGPPPAGKDEWQEFAASLEALTRRKK